MWTGGNTIPYAPGTVGAPPLQIGDELTQTFKRYEMWPAWPYEVTPDIRLLPKYEDEVLQHWISTRGINRNLAPDFSVRIVEDRLVAAIDIPGVKKGTVEVSLDGAMISVTGTRADTGARTAAQYTVPREYSVSPEDIEAWHDDGVLSIAFTRISQGRVKIGVR